MSELLPRRVLRDETARLDERVLVPAAEEVGRQLRVPGVLRLAHLEAGEDRKPESAQQTDGADGGGDRRHLLRPVGIAHVVTPFHA